MPDTAAPAKEDKGAFMEAPDDKEGKQDAPEDKGAFMEQPEGGAEDEAPDSADNHTEEETAAEQQRLGIHGDPWAPPGYFVDPNFRPNPLDVGTIITTEHAGRSSYDVKAYSGALANAGVHPLSLEENLPQSPEPPPPMGATDYNPDPTNVGTTEDTEQDKGVFMEQPEGETSDEEAAYAYSGRDQLAASAAQATEYNADPKNIPAPVPTEGETQAEGGDKGAFMEKPEGEEKAEEKPEEPKAEEKPPAAAPTPAKPAAQAQTAQTPAKPPVPAQGVVKQAPAKAAAPPKPAQQPAQQPAKPPSAPAAEARAKAQQTVQSAQETVQAVDKVNPAPPEPPGTKDTAMETHVTDAEAGGSTAS